MCFPRLLCHVHGQMLVGMKKQQQKTSSWKGSLMENRPGN